MRGLTRVRGEMKIISFINEAQVIHGILEQLRLWLGRPSGKPPEIQQTDGTTCRPFDDGWSGNEERASR